MIRWRGQVREFNYVLIVHMSEISDSVADEPSERLPEMNFRIADFPSDALSIKRFRKIFPQHFDGPDRIADGYSNNNFFFPSDTEKPEHLMWLTELICAERTVAAGAFYRICMKFDPSYQGVLIDEDEAVLAENKERLEKHYQRLKLADSPEAARLLIRQVESEGENQARRLLGPSL